MRDTRYNKFLGLRSILRLPEVKVQVAEGDLCVEDLESAWLEACAVKVRRFGGWFSSQLISSSLFHPSGAAGKDATHITCNCRYSSSLGFDWLISPTLYPLMVRACLPYFARSTRFIRLAGCCSNLIPPPPSLLALSARASTSCEKNNISEEDT